MKKKSRLALGTVQFGLNYGISNIQGRTSASEVAELLSFASSYQIQDLDTASGYGDSEATLGAVNVANFNIVSKLAGIREGVDDVEGWVKSEFNSSLLRMRLQKMYGYILHRPADLLSNKGNKIYSALLKLKSAGLVKKIGVSIYSPDELEVLLSRFDFDLVQAPFNVIDRRIATSGWMHKMKVMNIELHVRSIFLQGLLLMERGQIPLQFNRWTHLLDSWHQWLKKEKILPHEACIAFANGYPEIDKIIIGVNNLSQLKEVILAFESNQSIQLPDIESDNEQLINPSNWKN